MDLDSRPLAAWLLLALVLGGLGAASLWAGAPQRDQAPPFTLTTTGWEDGAETAPRTIRLADYEGTVLVLDLMAVNCVPCRAVTEEVLKPLHEAMGSGDAGFEVLSVDTWSDPASGNAFGGETDADIRRLQQETGVPWPHARDTDQVFLKYSAIQLPRLVVVDPDGRVVYAKAGLQDRDEVEAAIAEAQTGEAAVVGVPGVGLAALAVAAGAASVLSPCTVGLLPAYLGLLLDDAGGAVPGGPSRSRRILRAGLRTSLGVVSVYAVLAALFWAAGRALQPLVPWMRPGLGVALVAVGLLALSGRTWFRLDRLVRAGRLDARSGFARFGLAYGLAGFACTGPLFLPLLLAGFVRSPWHGATLFLLYTAAVASVVVAVALIVAAGDGTRLSRFLRNAKAVHRTAALLMVGAGVWLAWTWWAAV